MRYVALDSSGGLMSEANVLLRNVDLFTGVDRELVKKASDLCTLRHYDSDKIIFSQGDKPDGVYFLIDGRARASIFTYSGKNIVFKDLSSGEMLGEIAALDGVPRASTLVTLTPSKVAFLSTEALVDLMQENKIIMLRVCKSLAGYARDLAARVVEFSTLTVHNRIHAELLRLAGAKETDATEAVIHPIPTLADFASRISTHREAVSREISRLTKEGLLRRENGQLIITDVPKLYKLVHDATKDKSLV